MEYRRPVFFFLDFLIAASLILLLVPQPVLTPLAPKVLFFSMLAMLIWSAIWVDHEPTCVRTGAVLMAVVFAVLGLVGSL
jgi:hypothetical protein